MFRFFCPDLTLHSGRVSITDPAEIHHLQNVLRMREGAPIVLFNSPNIEARAIIDSISPGNVQCRVQSARTTAAAENRVILACAIPKKSKFETIIEKAVELGADEIIPLQTKRTIISLAGERLEKKQKRYDTVALNAVKQSRQTRVPRVHPVTDFSTLINTAAKSFSILIPSLEESTVPILTALDRLPASRPVLILIGPEGDFTPEEYQSARDAGAAAVSLGPTILKVETAALCALAAIQLHFQSLNPKHRHHLI